MTTTAKSRAYIEGDGYDGRARLVVTEGKDAASHKLTEAEAVRIATNLLMLARDMRRCRAERRAHAAKR